MSSELYAAQSDLSQMQWHNEPPRWSLEDRSLELVTADRTDFWQNTFYGFTRDDGHFLSTEITGDFTAEVTLEGEFEELYDQLGLMVRADERTWLKTGIEYTDGMPHLSAVYTNSWSDWSVIRLPDLTGRLDLRVTRHAEALRVQFRDADHSWQLLRLGYLALPESCRVGVMACSPQRAGFRARFHGFSIREPIPRELHE
jgi:regulation of enolase protein 1 (concanavalin A-like superfamily)